MINGRNSKHLEMTRASLKKGGVIKASQDLMALGYGYSDRAAYIRQAEKMNDVERARELEWKVGKHPGLANEQTPSIEAKRWFGWWAWLKRELTR